MCHAVVGEQFSQFLAAVDTGRHDHHRGARPGRQQQLEDRCVEARRGEMQCARVAVGVVTTMLLGVERSQPAVGHLDALGLSGGTRGVDDVSAICREDRTAALVYADAAGRVTVQDRVVDVEPGNGLRQSDGINPPGETDRRTRIGQHVLHAIGRVIRVDGNEGGTRTSHRPDREHRFDAAGDAQRNHVFGAETTRDQLACKTIGAIVEVPVGHALPAAHERDTVGVHVHGGIEQLAERGRRHRIDASDRYQIGHRLVVEQRDLAQYRTGIGDHSLQHPDETFGQRRGRGTVEDVGGVAEEARHAGRFPVVIPLLGELEGEVELAELGVHRTRGHREAFHVEDRTGIVVQPEDDLDERGMGRRPVRCERVDDLLEGHIAVDERVEVLRAHLGQEVGDGPVQRYLRTQHECVDEHADQRVELRGSASADRGTQGDIVVRSGTGEHNRQGGVDDHEVREAVGTGERHDAVVEARRHEEQVAGPDTAARVGTRAVGGQPDDLGQSGEVLPPEVELGRRQAARRGTAAEVLLLPDREVGVLDLQRFPTGRATFTASLVGGQQVGGQRPHRQTVRGDVVHDDHQQVLFGCARLRRFRFDPPESRPERHGLGDVETDTGERL